MWAGVMQKTATCTILQVSSFMAMHMCLRPCFPIMHATTAELYRLCFLCLPYIS